MAQRLCLDPEPDGGGIDRCYERGGKYFLDHFKSELDLTNLPALYIVFHSIGQVPEVIVFKGFAKDRLVLPDQEARTYFVNKLDLGDAKHFYAKYEPDKEQFRCREHDF